MADMDDGYKPGKVVSDESFDRANLGGYSLTPVAGRNDEHDPRFMTMLERVKRFDVREALANDAEAVEAQLDLLDVPRERQGEVLSLWDRIVIYGDRRVTMATNQTTA